MKAGLLTQFWSPEWSSSPAEKKRGVKWCFWRCQTWWLYNHMAPNQEVVETILNLNEITLPQWPLKGIQDAAQNDIWLKYPWTLPVTLKATQNRSERRQAPPLKRSGLQQCQSHHDCRIQVHMETVTKRLVKEKKKRSISFFVCIYHSGQTKILHNHSWSNIYVIYPSRRVSILTVTLLWFFW